MRGKGVIAAIDGNVYVYDRDCEDGDDDGDDDGDGGDDGDDGC